MLNDLPARRAAKNGMTQEELAAALGVSRQTVISIERGRYDPSLKLAFDIATYFNTTAEEIFHAHPERSTDSEAHPATVEP